MIVLLAMMVCGVATGFVATLVVALSEEHPDDRICARVGAGACSTSPLGSTGA